MLMDWRFWAAVGVALVVLGHLFPLSLPLPVGPITTWLMVIALALVGYELGKRLIP